METLRKHKWLIHWCAFAFLVIGFVLSAIFFETKTWLPNILQTIGTIIGMYLTLIIFLYSKEGDEKQFHEHLNHLQNLNHKQIEALQLLTEKQISALQQLTEKQIDALHKTTYEQISSFEKQSREITLKLSDNSILLAEILGRELENSLGVYDDAIKREEAVYNNLSGFKLLRTKEEREIQLTNQWNKIQKIKQGYEYLVDKYNQIRSFLGFGQKRLNG